MHFWRSPSLGPVALGLLLLPPPGVRAHGAGNWYDDLPNVKVLHPERDNQKVVDEIFRIQNNSHFGTHRYALLLTPGTYKEDFGIKVSYYTSVIGVGGSPSEVELNWVESPDGLNGHATNNFWRSVEGVTLWANRILWAVSQAAPMRRTIVKHDLWLSSPKGYSSGGFMSDVQVHGRLTMGTQQQWFFRNVDLWGGMSCTSGWNYVFVGLRGLNPQAQQACEGYTPGKVISVPQTFVAEKPFLVMEGPRSWYIHVPKFVSNVVGATATIIGYKLALEHEVFITRPGMTAEDINKGMEGKKGLLVTPGIYELKVPIEIKDDSFVVLGIGWPTLISTDGKPAVQVASGLQEVRVAGLLLEAGTPKRDEPTEPLLLWGADGPNKEYTLPGSAGGLASDIFVRVGSFKYRGCGLVRADTMMQVNSDDVVLDHVWLWHADHDDCGTDDGGADMELNVLGPSDRCKSTHGLVVNGRRVTSYGLAAEHTVDGHMLVWNGEEGDVYFYQSEVPYHSPDWGSRGFAGYVVAPHVERHTAHGVGVYIISSMLKGKVRSAFLLPEYANVYNLFNVTIGSKHSQFGSLACTENGGSCYGPEKCTPMRCFRPFFPRQKLPKARVQAFEQLQHKAKAESKQKGEAEEKVEEIVRDEVPPREGEAARSREAVVPEAPACRGRLGGRPSAACARTALSLWALPCLAALAAAVFAVHGIIRVRRSSTGRRTLFPNSDQTEDGFCAEE